MTMDEAFEISNILRCASPASRTEIASFAYMKRYEKGQHVFYDREDLTCFYILLEGMVSLYKLNTLGGKESDIRLRPGKPSE